MTAQEERPTTTSLGAYFSTSAAIASTSKLANLPIVTPMAIDTRNLSVAGLAGVRFDLLHSDFDNPRLVICVADVSSRDTEFAGRLVRSILSDERNPIQIEGVPSHEEQLRAEVTEVAVQTQNALGDSTPNDIRVSYARGVLSLHPDAVHFAAAGFGSVNFFRGYYDDERTRYALESVLPHAFLVGDIPIVANASFLRKGVNPQIVSATIDLSAIRESWIFGGNDVLRKITQIASIATPKDDREKRKANMGRFDPMRTDLRNFFLIDQMGLWRHLEISDRVSALVSAIMEQVDRFNFMPSQQRKGEDAAIAAIGVSLISHANTLSSSEIVN